MLLTIKKVGDWYYVVIAGRIDRFGYSTEDAAARRQETILAGWI